MFVVLVTSCHCHLIGFLESKQFKINIGLSNPNEYLHCGVMEQAKISENEYLQVRRISRWNKGVPPMKFTDMDTNSLGLNVAPIREDAYRSCMSNIEIVHSVKDDGEYPNPMHSGRSRRPVIKLNFSTK